MKKIIICLFLFFHFSLSANAQKLKIIENDSTNFDFQFVNVAQVVNLIFGEALKTSYVLDPEVLNDTRTVSFRYESKKGDLKPFLVNFLNSLGFSVIEKEGIQYVYKKSESQKLIDEQKVEKSLFIYLPKYRDVGYLTRLISPLFEGAFTTNKSIHPPSGMQVDSKVPPNSAAGLIDQTADTLIFSGTEKEVDILKNLLPQIDIKQGEVMVKGVLYEVSSSNKEGSAIALALDILGSKFGVSLGGAKTLDSFIKFKNKSIDFVFSALATDSRFKVVSTPSLSVRSGSTGTFTVGQDVPILGSISYQGSGNAVQAVEYKSSGVIFNVTPTVFENTIDLNVLQQVSNFVTTETGVNNSPTLIKREVKTSLSMNDGDVVVLGGLAENKETGNGSGLSFLPEFMKSKSDSNDKKEILLILQLTKF